MERSTILNSILSVFPIKKKKILFMSYWGKQYSCNPKYLSEYMVQHYPDWDIVWALEKPEKYKIDGIRIVKFPSLNYFYELNTCQFFVTNLRMLKHFQKRKGQFYIQTWHGILPIKAIEKDTESTLNRYYVNLAKKDSKQIDVLLSGCEKMTEIFQRSFWYNGLILPYGNPRQDILYEDDKYLKSRLKDKLNLKKNEKIVLYAPTFRKDNSLLHYDLDFSKIIHILRIKFGGQWKVLLRLHPNIAYLSTRLLKKLPNVIDVTSYEEVQELLLISDVVISDYSSLIFDFSITRRPCFLYTPDLFAYSHSDRRLYFDIKELPFPYAETKEQFYQNILDFSEEDYRFNLYSFMSSIGSYNNGNSCEKVVKYIIQQV